ncbi:MULTISPECIES: hypothetical protein, partial [unclassified Bradyrhizobium]|uniref:hypothetical protein n=1 Tax=unclassified Bradyrhizobium TaxID=2631580 RepID=UPI001CD66F41
PGLVLLQDPDNLLFRKAATLHALVLVVGQNELQTGLSPGGKVSAKRRIRFCAAQQATRASYFNPGKA